MASGLTSPAGDELELLRQQYDRLCELMTRAAESDPAAAERVLVELQSLSERILVLQTASADMPDTPLGSPPGPGFTLRDTAGMPAPAASPSMPAPLDVESGPSAPPKATPAAGTLPGAGSLAKPEPSATEGTAAPAPRPEGTPARIVAFRVTPSIGPRAGEAAPLPASWRIDAPPPDLGQPETGPAGHGAPTAPQAGRPALTPASAPAATPAKTIAPTVRQPASAAAPQQAPATPASATPPPPQPKPTAVAPTPATTAGPTAPPAASAPAAPGGAGNATLFSSAIRQWLERHRNGPEDSAAAAPAEVARITQPAEAPAQTPPRRQAPAVQDNGSGPDSSQAFSRVVAAVEQQAVQIERIIELCAGHQLALERLEARLEARLVAQPAAPPAPDPELGELRTAVEEQRQRITSLAKTIHNLAQWLATQRAAPDR